MSNTRIISLPPVLIQLYHLVIFVLLISLEQGQVYLHFSFPYCSNLRVEEGRLHNFQLPELWDRNTSTHTDWLTESDVRINMHAYFLNEENLHRNMNLFLVLLTRVNSLADQLRGN